MGGEREGIKQTAASRASRASEKLCLQLESPTRSLNSSTIFHVEWWSEMTGDRS